MINKKLKKVLVVLLIINMLIAFIGQSYVNGAGEEVDRDYIESMYRHYYANTGTEEQFSLVPMEQFIANVKLDEILEAYNEIHANNPNLDTTEKLKQAIQTAYNNNVLEDTLNLIVSYAGREGMPEGPIEGGESGESGGNGTSSGSGLGNVVDGVVGVVFYVFKLIPLGMGKVIMTVLNWILVGTDNLTAGMSIDKILFNEVPLLSVDFFQEESSGVWNSKSINEIRKNIAIWYVSLRNLAAAILAVMVLYVGIRIAISTAVDEKARYKKMLADWVVSLLLLFVLHYIIIFVIRINDTLVDIISMARDTKASGESVNIINQIGINALKEISFIKGWTFTFIYFMFCIMTFIFLITYVKRMITIAFLVMISPIITITYSIDKMGDGKSQALNKWFKEFVYNILLQPFQCIIYLSLVQTSMKSLDDANIAIALVCILMVIFMYEAEDIVKEIFHFDSKSVAKTIGQAALVTAGLGLLSKSGTKGEANSSSRGRKKSPSTRDSGGNGGRGGNGGSGRDGDQGGNGGRGGNGGSGGNGDQGGNGGRGGNGDQGGNDGSNGKRGMIGKVAGTAGKVVAGGLKGVGRTGMRLTGAMMFGAAGAATGNLSTAISGATAGFNIANKHIAKQEQKAEQRSLAKSYRGEVSDAGKAIYGSADDNWIRQHTKDLLNGDLEAEDYERDYYNAAMKAKDFYMDRGMSEEDAVSAVDKDIAGIQGGYIGEETIGQRFTGKIKSKFAS